jgi:NAD-dependent SIR2 family protein deacetylase
MSSQLTDFIAAHERIFALTGAGVSTASGIPDYRDHGGEWKHRKPMEYREFVASVTARQRYWARSYLGWQNFSRAEPNPAHRALAGLEELGLLAHTVTQNVDGLHQRAGSRRLTELHGSLSSVECLDCGGSLERSDLQRALLDRNPQLETLVGELTPDGDARLRNFDDTGLDVPACQACGGILKPAVVFFGESVPRARVQRCRDALAGADAMLVVGSSLMVYSGFRFVREAAQQGIPIVAVNRGKTRADEMLKFKLELDCATALSACLAQLAPGSPVVAERDCDAMPR